MTTEMVLYFTPYIFNMQTGDSVRVKHGTEQGTIIRFLDKGLVEIEIEDGFSIPILKSDLVVVNALEHENFKQAPTPSSPEKETSFSSTKALTYNGVYVGFKRDNDMSVKLYVVNNTDLDLLTAAGEKRQNKYNGIFTGNIPARTYTIIADRLEETKLNDWPVFTFQMTKHRTNNDQQPELIQRDISVKPSSYFKSKKSIPLVGETGYVQQIDLPHHQYNPETLKEALMTNSAIHEPKQQDTSLHRRAPVEVDLHFEQITTEENVPDNEILSVQLSEFEKALDAAIASGVDEITFIHGTGSGKLRTEIHRRLSGHTHVSFFKDANKQKFGYGATYVRIGS